MIKLDYDEIFEGDPLTERKEVRSYIEFQSGKNVIEFVKTPNQSHDIDLILRKCSSKLD